MSNAATLPIVALIAANVLCNVTPVTVKVRTRGSNDVFLVRRVDTTDRVLYVTAQDTASSEPFQLYWHDIEALEFTL